MPGSFDDVLYINEHGCLSPAGPLQLAGDETAVRLDVWVWQDASACIALQRERDLRDRKRWEITTDPKENHVGPDFQPGAASAKGLMVTERRDAQGKVLETKTYEWTKGILLVDGKTKSFLLVDGKTKPFPSKEGIG